MIEFISKERCIQCNQCVYVCPKNVFDRVEGEETPVIARVDDCQTCFMCEAYCPADALYVSPEADELTGVTEVELQNQFLGEYRKQVFKHDFV